MTEKEIIDFLQRGIKLNEQTKTQYIRVKSLEEIDTDRTEELEKHIATLKIELSNNMEKLEDIEAEIITFIKESNLTDLEKTILEMRYFCYKRWQDIGDDVGYTETYLLKLHRDIIKKLTFEKKCVTNHNQS